MKLTPVQQKFILHWGEMGSTWGLNRTVAQIHAMLYLSAAPLTAEEISETLGLAHVGPDDDFFELGGDSLQAAVIVNRLQQQLGQDYSVRSIDLQSGQVPPDVDTLVVIAPQNMTDKERYAIDQYLMRGGSVIVGAGNYSIAQSPTGGVGVAPLQNGLNDMLASYGVQISPTLVMDPQNEPFPVQVTRNVGGFAVQEVQAINFPFFPDIRANAMDRTNPIVSQLSENGITVRIDNTVDRGAGAVVEAARRIVDEAVGIDDPIAPEQVEAHKWT